MRSFGMDEFQAKIEAAARAISSSVRLLSVGSFTSSSFANARTPVNTLDSLLCCALLCKAGYMARKRHDGVFDPQPL